MEQQLELSGNNVGHCPLIFLINMHLKSVCGIPPPRSYRANDLILGLYMTLDVLNQAFIMKCFNVKMLNVAAVFDKYKDVENPLYFMVVVNSNFLAEN